MNDIVLKVNNTEIKGQDILSAVDALLDHVRETGDAIAAEDALLSLKGIERVTGKAIAKLLYGLQAWWEETNQEEVTGDSFKDWLESIDVDFNDTYVKRLVLIQKYEEDGVFSERLMEQPIKVKQAIASHLEQGYDLNKKEIKELERATSEYEAGEILRRAKGKPPRKNTLGLTLERDGTLNVWYQGEVFFRGYLVPVDEAETELQREAFEKSLSRLTKNTGVKIK